jgi:hypothetical protein
MLDDLDDQRVPDGATTNGLWASPDVSNTQAAIALAFLFSRNAAASKSVVAGPARPAGSCWKTQ